MRLQDRRFRVGMWLPKDYAAYVSVGFARYFRLGGGS